MDLISKTHWDNYSHAFGSASDLTATLHDLFSGNPDLVDAAIANLHATICHQGTVYSATAPVVPILYEALEHAETNGTEIAYLIACIANGNGYYSRKHKLLEPLYNIWRETLADQGTTLEHVRREESVYINYIRNAVSENFPQLLPYIESDDDNVREEMAMAVNKFPEHSKIALPHLKRQLMVESNQKIRRMIDYAITKLEASTQNAE